MYFCEKCNALMQNKTCANCGKKNLREVRDGDFCFYTSLSTDHARYFEENLKLRNIPVAMLGVGLDLRTKTSGTFNIYIPYGYFEKATEVYNLLFGRNEANYDELTNLKFKAVVPQKYAEELKEKFFNNPDLWYEKISPASVAKELMETVEGDYSEIWNDYCALCDKPIDKNTTENFYLSEEECAWICRDCFEKHKQKFNFKLK